MRPLSHRIAALAVVCVFATLPSLARIHDRLTAHDEVTRFRLSQNLERPHEKTVAVCLMATPVFQIAVDTAMPVVVALPRWSTLDNAFASPTGPRAPPVR